MSFCLLVPVKALRHSKTRLETGDRARLMRAFATDALAAAAASPAVALLYAVTDEPALAEVVEGVAVLPDHGGGDLNAALRAAERSCRLQHPGLAVAAMCADLPALRTDDLTAALDLALAGALGPRWYVADADGTGTTLLAAAPGADLDPHFGPGSARAHEVSGASPVRAALQTLRRDVDTEADLRAAAALGLGPRSRALLGAG